LAASHLAAQGMVQPRASHADTGMWHFFIFFKLTNWTKIIVTTDRTIFSPRPFWMP
jgi:hypothetical protein